MNVAEPVSFALAPSMSIDTVVARRDAFIASLHALESSYREMQRIRQSIFGAPEGESPRTDYDTCLQWSSTRRDLDDAGQLDEAIKRVDAACWAHMLKLSGLEQLMDAKLRAEWREQLDKRLMPEFTRANIDATFRRLGGERADIFERGVVNVFKSLSWSYHANSPVKLGKRMIVTYAAERSTHYDKNNHRQMTTVYGPTHSFADKLDDLVRALCVLEGKPEPSHDRGAYSTMRAGGEGWMAHEQLAPGATPAQRDCELHGYVRFRGFKNGNAHLTFLRLDLVDKLNLIIAKHFPNALPPARET